MDEELDLVNFVDDDGKEVTMEVLDYFFYEGEEYAVLTEYDENDACEGCEQENCEGCENEAQKDAFIMKVVPVGDDQEEFLPVDDDLADKLIEIAQKELYGDEDEDDEE